MRNIKDRQTRANIRISPQRRKLKEIKQMLTINQRNFSEIKKKIEIHIERVLLASEGTNSEQSTFSIF